LRTYRWGEKGGGRVRTTLELGQGGGVEGGKDGDCWVGCVENIHSAPWEYKKRRGTRGIQPAAPCEKMDKAALFVRSAPGSKRKRWLTQCFQLSRKPAAARATKIFGEEEGGKSSCIDHYGGMRRRVRCHGRRKGGRFRPKQWALERVVKP